MDSLKSTISIHKPFSSFSSSSSSLSSGPKLKALLKTFILSHIYRISRTLRTAASLFRQLIRNINYVHFIEFPSMKKKNQKKRLYFGSFRLHYNWCSNPRGMPVGSHAYFDSSWNSVIPAPESDQGSSDDKLAGYLRWLEDKEEDACSNEIDRLADLFIADCHAKLLLEKQESYRRFQEMMARSV